MQWDFLNIHMHEFTHYSRAIANKPYPVLLPLHAVHTIREADAEWADYVIRQAVSGWAE